jgi:hypothetical protein
LFYIQNHLIIFLWLS